MNDNKLKQKVQRGGALLLVAVMCFTGLVGCGTKKPNKDLNKKPGTTQVEPTKKPSSSKVDTDKKGDKDTCQRQCDFVVFRRTGNVGKRRVKVCSLWIIILAVFARQV